MKKPVKKQIKKSCDNCEYCTYIGEGDYACFAEPLIAKIVKSDHIPAEDYFYCQGEKWIQSE